MFTLLVLSLAQPPTFTVVNHCPTPIVVVNHCPPVKAAPAVAATRVFQHNASHNCPSCGRGVYVIAGYVAGGHYHRCPVDGTTWWHN
jgi:hypothetical protein